MLGMPFVRQFISQTAATDEIGRSTKIRTAEMRVRQCTLLSVAVFDANTSSCDAQAVGSADATMRQYKIASKEAAASAARAQGIAS
jgi:hypothetical protein